MLLIVFGGLPAAGKTTIARALATRLAATYLRIDAIEQAMRDALPANAPPIGPAGYGVANMLAESNLGIGRPVVADCVNPVAESRAAWRAIAARTQTRLIDIEVICSDPQEHRRRAETRSADIPGHINPSWQEIQNRHYEPWADPSLTLDTARLNPDACLRMIEQVIAATR